MKVKIFYGRLEEVEKRFNEWAKGKALTKNVIIHSAISPAPAIGSVDLCAIFIYYPEGSQFDEGESK